MPGPWILHLSPRRRAIEETSLEQAVTTTAIGAGTAFALLAALLVILTILGPAAAYVRSWSAERAARKGRLRRQRATAAVIAVGVLKARREAAGRGEN